MKKITIINISTVSTINLLYYIKKLIEGNEQNKPGNYCDRIFYGDTDLNVEISVTKKHLKIIIENSGEI